MHLNCVDFIAQPKNIKVELPKVTITYKLQFLLKAIVNLNGDPLKPNFLAADDDRKYWSLLFSNVKKSGHKEICTHPCMKLKP